MDIELEDARRSLLTRTWDIDVTKVRFHGVSCQRFSKDELIKMIGLAARRYDRRMDKEHHKLMESVR